ncbi:uncharacterized protein [Paramisgurnus dabryanus]|uniref:uncharacterized protein isoform X2 n=1 Tax=Paramisgurnus dabryanus TaxID=90735 RepID=UPI0031F34E2F
MRRSWMMGAFNVGLLVLLVWTFTAVCEADDDIAINCEDVTAPVGDKITLTCRFSHLNEGCCAKWYKFIDTAAANDPDICRENFIDDPCKKERFSCLYTANKAMTTKFKFFVQTNCGGETTEFSVNITGPDTDDGAGGPDSVKDEKTPGLDNSSVAVIIGLLGCFIIVIVALIFWMRRKPSRSPHDYDMGVSRPPQDYNMCACENNTIEPSDREAMLKETSVNVQIEKPQCQCNCNHNITSS